jgi:PKHD-type hydroxylase
MQFTKYKSNQHYDWHQDAFVEAYKSEDVHFMNKIRKLSTVVFLSDPKDYEGGEFLVDFPHPKIKNKPIEIKEAKKRGSILIMPSFIWHCVKPVTKGTRYSLVCWSLGPSFT